MTLKDSSDSQAEAAISVDPRTLVVALVGIVLGALVLRVIAARGDLWFDEVWTWMLVRELDSPLDVFVMHHDNNHYLNSLWFYLMGEDASALLYRLPAIVSGTGTTILAAWIAHRRGRLEALVTAFLFATCFLFILYDSEARGYGLASFFALASFATARRHLERPTAASAAMFWVFPCLGILAHLSSVLVYGAIGLWSIASFARRCDSQKAFWVEMLRMHALPSLFIVWIYWVDVSHIEVVPGEQENFFAVLMRVVAHVARLPGPLAIDGLMFLLAAVVVVAAIIRMIRARDLEWVFLAGIIASGPLLYGASLVVFESLPYVVRYFLVAFVFLLLASAYTLADWLRAAGLPRLVAICFLVLTSLGNAQLTLELFEKRRGGYSEALAQIAAMSAVPPILVASNEDLQSGYLVLYHASRNPETREIVYLPHWKWNEHAPAWFIEQSYLRSHVPERRIRRAGLDFELVSRYPAGPYSGWPWYVYKRSRARDPLARP